jgi:hypothetical protein
MAHRKRSAFHVVLGVTLSLALAACSGAPEAMKRGRGGPPAKPKTAQPAGTPAFTSAESRQCLVDLQRANVKHTPLANQTFGGGCQAIDSVKLLDIGVPVTNLGALTCPLARTFSAWSQYAVRPAARQFFGKEVVKIETFGTYSCRNIYGRSTGKLSEHARSNAIDISAFVLSDGRRITVLAGWNGARDEQAFLRALHRSACRRFGTALGPDYNSAHHNHFHFDMGGNGFCR